MDRSNRDSPSAGERVAQLAVAQYLLFDATVESLSILTERFVHPRTARALGETKPHALMEPFQSRFDLLRRMIDQPEEPERRLEPKSPNEAPRAAAMASAVERVTPAKSTPARGTSKPRSAKTKKHARRAKRSGSRA